VVVSSSSLDSTTTVSTDSSAGVSSTDGSGCSSTTTSMVGVGSPANVRLSTAPPLTLENWYSTKTSLLSAATTAIR